MTSPPLQRKAHETPGGGTSHGEHKLGVVKNDLVPPKKVSADQVRWLREERPVGTYGFYDGRERFRFADQLPTTSRRAVKGWDWAFVATVRAASGVLTLIEAHRPDPKAGKQDAGLYLYIERGGGGEVHQLKHPVYEGRSVPLETAPSSGIAASALARSLGLFEQSGLTGTLEDEHLKSLKHIQAILLACKA